MQPIWGLSGSWHFGTMLLILAFWGVVIAGVVLSIRWLRIQGRRPQSDAALEALRQRYAKGEISKQEFETQRTSLGQSEEGDGP